MNEPVRLPGSRCLNCGKLTDAASSLKNGVVPVPGDVTICFYCGHIMSFAADMTLCELTDAQIVEVAGDPDIIKIQKMIAWARDNAARKSN